MKNWIEFESQLEPTEDWSEGLSNYIEIFSLGSSTIKNTSQFFLTFFLPLFYATFHCGRYNIFKKKLNLFFAHENINNRASKVAHNRPKLFFHKYSPAAQTSPELIFHIINMSQDSSVSLSVAQVLPTLALYLVLKTPQL